ncbi:MAG: DUF481 domain-containing protein [Terriglobales bacterium]
MRPIFVLISVLLFCAFCNADVVRLTNGDRITGEVTSLGSGALEVKTDYAGVIKIQLTKVAEISADTPLHLSAGENEFVVHDVRVWDGKLQLEPASAAPVSVPSVAVRDLLSEKAYRDHERLLHASMFQLWSGSANAGFSAARGNSGATTFDVGMTAARVTARDKFEVFFNSLFASNSANNAGVTSANSVRSGISDAINLSPRLFTFAFTNFETDALQKLDLRNVSGGGMGVDVLRQRHLSWDVFSGGSLNQELYSEQALRRSGEALFGQELTNAPMTGMLISERLTVFPNLTNPGEYRVGLQSTATVKLNAWLGWQVSLNDTYVSNPPLGSAVNNNMLISTGLRFNLGQEHAFSPRSKLAELLR